MQEEAEGAFGGKHYYRLGILGYSPADDRYEWSTVHSVTPMTMSYKGSGSDADTVMAGEFTDPVVLVRSSWARRFRCGRCSSRLGGSGDHGDLLRTAR